MFDLNGMVKILGLFERAVAALERIAKALEVSNGKKG